MQSLSLVNKKEGYLKLRFEHSAAWGQIYNLSYENSSSLTRLTLIHYSPRFLALEWRAVTY